MNMTHPVRRKSGADLVVMTKPKQEVVAVEITTIGETTFETKSLEIAKAFLRALDETEVAMVTGKTSVTTGADIALLILERETPKKQHQPLVSQETLRNIQ